MPSPAPERLAYQPEAEIARAGAGAGKTFALVSKVAEVARRFKRENGRWPRMVATTFTRKATQELRERLMLKALAEAADGAPELVEFVNSRGNISVTTIHGALDMFLRRHGAEMAIDPGYKIVGGSEAGRIARRALRDCLFAQGGRADLLERYSFEKLAFLARKYDEFKSRDPGARACAVADFAELALQEARAVALALDQAAALVRAEATKPDWLAMAGALSGLAEALRQGECDWRANRPVALALISALKKARWSEKKPPASEEANAACDEALRRARALAGDAYDPANWDFLASEFAAFEELAAKFSALFRAAKAARGELEISDLESLAMECARRYPGLAESFASEWDFWLIDEYQDTSPFQVELLRRLVQAKPVYIVGDPQQSIYLFRGARSEVFAEKEREIEAAGGRLGFLRRNYRSRPELLLFFNEFFGRLSPPFAAMEPNLAEGEATDPSRVVATFYVAGAPSDAGPAAAAVADAADAEWKALVRRAQDLLSAPSEAAKPEDICVLARTNRDLVEAAKWLSRFGIPTHVHAASGFYDRRETLDALSFLKFLANPHDDGNLIQLLRSPWFRVPDEALARLASARGHGRAADSVEGPGLAGARPSFWREIERSEEARAWESARALARGLARAREAGVAQAFREGLVASGLIDFSHMHDSSGRRESNAWKLLAQLAQEEAMPGFNPLAFVSGRALDARGAEGGQEGDAVAALEPDRVNLMTIHASKGLQFKHVLLPRMGQPARLTRFEEFCFDEDRRHWSFRAPMGDEGKSEASLAERAWLGKFQAQERLEHLRVLYVALTRAKETVYMSWTEPAREPSWASALRWPLAPGTTRFRDFSVETWPPEPPEPLEAAWRDPSAAGLRPRAGGGRAPAAESPPRRASVTQLLSDAAKSRPGLSPLSSLERRSQVVREGVAMHRLMELLRNPSQSQLAILARKWFPSREQEALAAIQWAQALREPPLLQLIRDGAAEWGYAAREGRAIVEGQIDLWGRDEGGTLWIVDYKSGSPERRALAQAQLSLYALGLRRAGELREGERARLAAVYPFSGQVFVEPEPDPSATRAKFGLA